MRQNWQWQRATGADVPDIVAMAQTHFECEIDQIFRPDPIVYERNLMRAIVEQFYVPGSEFVWLARSDRLGRLLGYVWAHRSQAPWSDDAMCAVRMVHVDLDLTPRDRVRMIREMIMTWELWCVENHIPVICSSTMRGDQQAFLKIHQRMGYDVRGSFAYKRLGS
jgi:hypothetical protein